MRKKIPINLLDDSTDYIKKISVDLPTSEEAVMGREAWDTYCGNRIEVSDMSRLTGAQTKYDEYYLLYLRDFREDDKRNIQYMDTHFFNREKKDLKDSSRVISLNRCRRGFSILPTLHFDECPELFNILVDNFSDDGKTINLGEFPQSIGSKETQFKLNEAFKNKKVKETEETYVFDAVDPFKEIIDYNFVPLVSKVYEYEGKKYLRWKITDLYNHGYGRFIISGDCKYRCGNTVWVEIEPVKYLIIPANNIFISEKCLVSGIQYTNFDKNVLNLNYEDSNAKFYMETFMKPKLLRNVSKMIRDAIIEGKKYRSAIDKIYEERKDDNSLPPYGDVLAQARLISTKFNVDPHIIHKRLNLLSLPKEILEQLLGPYVEDNTKETNDVSLNEKTREIMALRNEVIRYMKHDLGEPDSLEKVDKLINEYNEKVKTYNELELTLNPGGNSPHNLYLRLKVDLNEIVERLRDISEKVSGFIDMLEILEECKKEDINENFDSICKMIKIAKPIINGFLLNEKKKKRLNIELEEVINRHINICRNGIENYKKHNIISNKTVDNLKADFRKDISPFLYNLRKAVVEQDVVNSIVENVNMTLAEQRKEIYDQRIAYFVKEIDNVTSRIKTKGNEQEKKELEEISNSLNVDKTQDIHTVIRAYVDALSKAIHLEDKIDTRKAKEKARSDDIINIPEDSTVNKR